MEKSRVLKHMNLKEKIINKHQNNSKRRNQKNNTRFAPVIMTAYGRSELLKNCIESLGRNTEAINTDLYIGLDYPKRIEDRQEYEKVEKYLNGAFPQFNSVNVIRREKNLGPLKNLRSLVKMIQKVSDTWIFIAEDEEFSPNFLSYMNSILTAYKDDQDVVAVTGYSYPVNWVIKDGCNCVKQNLTANDWGIGYWKDKYNKMNHYFKQYGLQKAYKDFRLRGFPGLTDWAIKDYTSVAGGMLPYHSYLMEVYDISLRIYLSVCHKYVIMPSISKVRQLGFDGSGINCPEIIIEENKDITSTNFDWKTQEIDDGKQFKLIIDNEFNQDENRKLLNQFDKVDPNELKSFIESTDEFMRHGDWYRHYVNIRYLIRKLLRRSR